MMCADQLQRFHRVRRGYLIIIVVASYSLIALNSQFGALYVDSVFQNKVIDAIKLDVRSIDEEKALLRSAVHEDELPKKQYTNDVLKEKHNVSHNSTSSKNLKILHLTPLYKVETCDDRFCPYNRDQSIAIASILRARFECGQVHVTLATSVFPDDAEAVPKEFIRLKDLSRSAATEYPELNITRRLPFANDLFDNLRSWESFDTFDYVIYTNADIIVRNDFYDVVANIISSGYDGFTINRQTVSETNAGEKENGYTDNDLDEIYNLEGKVHPGSDCFIMKRDLFNRINMGDVFLGYAPVANIMFIQVQSYAQKFRIFTTNDLKATYHLGDDRSWQGKGTTDRKLALQNIENAYMLEVWSNMCKFHIRHTNLPQTRNVVFEGNSLPCTRLAYKFWCEEYDPCKVANCTRTTSISTGNVSCPITTKLGFMTTTTLR